MYMKLLVLSDHISKDMKNGTWEFAYKFSKYASELCEVSIVCFFYELKPDSQDFEEEGNLKIYRIRNFLAGKAIIKNIKHDVAFIHTTKMYALYKFSMGLKSKSTVSMIQGTSYIERLLNIGKKDIKYYALRLFETYRSWSSNVLFFASKYMMDNYVRTYNNFRKSTYLPLAVDKPAITKSLPKKEKYIEEMISKDIKDGYKILFCIRRIVSRTGVLHLVDMMEYLKEYKIKLYIAGTGTHFEALKRKIEGSHLTYCIITLGAISDEAKNWIYKKSYLSIVPTRTLEGFCLSMLESMSYGCPPVVTPVGGMYEFMKDRGLQPLITTGFAPMQMAKTVEFFIKNKGERNFYSKKCKDISTHYHYDDISRRFLMEIAYMLEKVGKSVNFMEEVNSGQ